MKCVIVAILSLAFVNCSTTRAVAPTAVIPTAAPAATLSSTPVAPTVDDNTVLPGEVVVEYPVFPLAIIVDGANVGVVESDKESNENVKVTLLSLQRGSNMYPVRLGREYRKGDRHWAIFIEKEMYGMAGYEKNGQYEKFDLNVGRFAKWNYDRQPHQCLDDREQLKLYLQAVPFCGTLLRWQYNITMGVAAVPTSVMVQEVPTSVKVRKIEPLKAQEVP